MYIHPNQTQMKSPCQCNISRGYRDERAIAAGTELEFAQSAGEVDAAATRKHVSEFASRAIWKSNNNMHAYKQYAWI